LASLMYMSVDVPVNTTAAGRRFGPYLVQRRLGGGAMATVYQALDERNGQAVALKVLLAEADEVMRQRFHQEARMAGALNHPNIIHTLEIGQSAPEDATFIAMELVQGESLSDLLERAHSLTPTDASALLAPIAQALAYAHGQGVVHRDVKPSNILLRRASGNDAHAVRLTILGNPVTPLLSDFGIARALDAPDLTTIGRTIGTPAYMAPEQCAGNRDMDGRADIYSLGAVLYRCLVGRPPFGGTTTQILYAHVYDPVSVPDNVLRLLSPLMVEVLRRALAKEPEERYASANQMADDLATSVGRAAGGEGQSRTAAAVESTATMPSLSPPLPTTTSHIIVNAARPQASSFAAPAPPQPIPLEAPRPTQKVAAGAARLPRRWRGMLIALLLSAFVFLLGTFMMRALLPEIYLGAFSGSQTIQPTAEGATPMQAASEATAQPNAPDAPQTPASQGVENRPGATPAPQPQQSEAPTPAPLLSPTPGPTPAGDIRAYLQEAIGFHEDRDWRSALDWLTLVQRIDPNYEHGQVERMLFDVYVALGNAANAGAQFDEAVVYFDRALKLRPTAGPIEILRAATQAVLDADPPEKINAQRILQNHYADFATELEGLQRKCDAADHLDAAAGVYPDPQYSALAATLRTDCRKEIVRAEDEEALRKLSGSFIYSAARDGRQQIFTMPASPGALSQMVIDNGAQPALSPNGVRVAFHSKRPDAQGLAGFDLHTGLDPNARSILFTRFTEDSRDSPPAWNSEGNRLVFASTNDADRRSRIYATWADGQANPTMLNFGQSPAWNWNTDTIVFNGADPNGQRPGLWLMGSDGSNLRPLTQGSGDLRPTWTPDGSSVLFMSTERDGNWELYQANIADGAVRRLTEHLAVDALPTVSPDGKWAAFVSNRDGGWRLWVISLVTGNAFPLAGLAGDLSNLLDHAVQWTP
jgi:serine/threonine-protein kinase